MYQPAIKIAPIIDKVEDVTTAVVYLARPAAPMVTEHTFIVDGGGIVL